MIHAGLFVFEEPILALLRGTEGLPLPIDRDSCGNLARATRCGGPLPVDMSRDICGMRFLQ